MAKTKYEAEIDGKQVSVEIEERDGRVLATIGNRDYDLSVVRPEGGAYLIFDGDQVYEARVGLAESNSLRVKLRGRTYATAIIDRKHRRSSGEHSEEGRHNLTAPMPGKVVSVLVAEGDEVAAGQGVVIVEAMKMQNEMKSPKAGRIVELRVSEGATVNAGQVLVVVE